MDLRAQGMDLRAQGTDLRAQGTDLRTQGTEGIGAYLYFVLPALGVIGVSAAYNVVAGRLLGQDTNVVLTHLV